MRIHLTMNEKKPIFAINLVAKLIELLDSLKLVPESGFGEVTLIFQSGKLHRVVKKDDILIK